MSRNCEINMTVKGTWQAPVCGEPATKQVQIQHVEYGGTGGLNDYRITDDWDTFWVCDHHYELLGRMPSTAVQL